MLIPGHKPRLEPMTLRAVAAQALETRTLPIVASGAVEAIACGAGVKLVRASIAELCLQRFERGLAVEVPLRCTRKCPRAHLVGEYDVGWGGGCGASGFSE